MCLGYDLNEGSLVNFSLQCINYLDTKKRKFTFES